MKSDFKGKHLKVNNWGTTDFYFTKGIHKRLFLRANSFIVFQII